MAGTVVSGSGRRGRPLRLRMKQPPGHGADLVEEVENAIDSPPINSTSTGKELNVRVDLLCRRVRDTPVVKPVSTRSTMTLCEIRRNRAGSSYDLVGKTLQGRRDPNDKRKSTARCFERGRMDDELVAAEWLTHGDLRVVHDASPNAAGVAGVKGRLRPPGSPLTPVTPAAIPHRGMNHPEITIRARRYP